jgi:hypothetical protein
MQTKVYYNPASGQGSLIPWRKEEAILAGEYFYRDAQCRDDPSHGDVRLVANDVCKQCMIEWTREDHRDNQELDPTYPSCAASAIAQGVDYYYTGYCCFRGGHRLKADLRTGRCQECAEQRRTPRAAARKAGKTVYIPAKPCAGCGTKAERTVVQDRCYGCNPPQREHGGARAIARTEHRAKYTPTEPCAECGQLAERRTQDDKCYGCHPLRNLVDPARAIARKSGAYTYRSASPCAECGQLAERRTQDNRCYGCKPRYGISVAPPSPAPGSTPTDAATPHCVDLNAYRRIAADYGPMVVDHADAVAMGLPVYRTGAACTRGHVGWRVASTGACLECTDER